MLHIPLRTPWLDRLVHVEAVCPKNGNLNGEDIRETHDQRNQRDLGRSGLEDFEAFVAACRMTRSRPLPRLHLRETRQRAEQLPDIQIIVASGPQNITRHGTPAFHANTGLASYTIYHLPIIYHHLSVGCSMMSFRKTKPRPTGRGQQNWLANHLMIWARGCCSQAKGSRPEIGGAPVTAMGMPVKGCKHPANASTFCELFIKLLHIIAMFVH